MNQTRISLLAAVAISLPLATTTAQAATPPGPLCCTRPTGCSSATVGMKQVYFAPSAFPGSITLQPNATNLTLIGTGSFSSINGNSLANGIVGSAGNDTITDGGGKDTIFVGSGNNITGRNSDIVFGGTNGEADTVKLSPDGVQDTIHIGTSLEMSPPAPYLGTNHYNSNGGTALCSAANRISRRGFTAENLAESLPSRLELLAQNSTTANGDYRAGVTNLPTSKEVTQPIALAPNFLLIRGVANVLTPDLGGKSGDQIVAAGSDFGFSDDQIRKYQKGRPPIQVTNSKETASLKLGSEQPSVVYFTDNGWLTALTRKADGEIAGKVIVRLLDLKGNPVRLSLTTSGTAGNDFLRIVPAAKQGRVVAGLR